MRWFLIQIYFLSVFLLQSFCNAEAEKVGDPMIYSMVKLLDLEESLKSNFEKYVQETQAQLDMIKLYLGSIIRGPQLTKLEEKEEYVANPLNALPLLRRLNQDWPKPSLGVPRYHWG